MPSIDYSLPVNEVPNGLHGVNGHPSERAVAFDTAIQKTIYLDTVIPIAPSWTYYSFSKSPRVTPSTTYDLVPGPSSPLGFGYSTCHWLAPCDASNGDVPGTPCNATLGGVFWQGFCFESSKGSLECGHTTSLDNRNGSNPISIGEMKPPNVLPSTAGFFTAKPDATLTTLPSATLRCERGSASASGATFVSKRLLLAGCMIASDSNFDQLADIHVPSYCSVPTDYLKGCMVPSASNYDPGAKQSDICYYQNTGCLDSTALNYNAEANFPDPASCVLPVYGCTIDNRTYSHLTETDTPGYQSGYVATHSQGLAYEDSGVYTAATVTNYNPMANVNQGCVLAIEGCMDPTALNYDSHATVSTHTWCVPLLEGCMMPPLSLAGAVFEAKWPTQHKISGLGANWNAAASRHSKAACKVERVGCMVPTSEDGIAHMNYDPHATVSATCYPAIDGCLNPNALNYNCDVFQNTPCPDSSKVITRHDKGVCDFGGPPNPPPPPIVAEAGKKIVERHASVVSLRAAGDVSDYDTEKIETMKGVFASMSGASANDVSLEIIAASVIIKATILFSNADAASAASSAISSSLASVEAASSMLGITVQSLPIVETAVVAVEVEADDGGIPWIIVGPAAGGGVALILLILILIYCRRKRRRTTKVKVQVEPDDDD